MPEPNEPLSEREVEILRLVATGAANKEIARQLVISPNTVKVHLRNIFTKIGVASRTEATLYAVQIGLVKPSALADLSEPSEDLGEEERLPAASNRATSAGGPWQPSPSPFPIAAINQDAPAVLQPAGLALPGTAIERVGSTPAQRAFPALRFALILLALPVLLVAGVWGVRSFLLPQMNPTATSPSTTQQTGADLQRWATHTALPAPRKGMGIAEYENALYVVGGETAQGVDGALLRYTPNEDAWQALTNKPTAVTDIGAALLGEKIYIPGGQLANGQATAILEVYDPRQDTWETRAPLPTPLSAYALAAFEGNLYLFGGKNGSQIASSVYIYDPREDQWQERNPLDTPRAYARAVVMNGRIHVLGGFDGQHALALNQAYFPSREQSGEKSWEDFAPLPQARYAMGAASLANIAYLIGGLAEDGALDTSNAMDYSAQTNQWHTADTPLSADSAFPALFASGNYLFILGGETASGLSAANRSYQAIYTIAVPIMSNGK